MVPVEAVPNKDTNDEVPKPAAAPAPAEASPFALIVNAAMVALTEDRLVGGIGGAFFRLSTI